jgi:DNA-binding phage protein
MRHKTRFELDFTPLAEALKDVSRAQVAEYTGLDDWTLGRFVHCKSEPTVTALVAISGALGIPIYQLYRLAETD